MRQAWSVGRFRFPLRGQAGSEAASAGIEAAECRQFPRAIRADGMVGARAARRGGDFGVNVAANSRRFVGASRGDGTIGAKAVGSRQRGYTLVEVIVAFGVLALGLVLLLGTLSGSSRQVRHANDAGRAALHAQSLLDQAGVGQPLQPGRQEGALEDGRYRWVLDARPYVDPTIPAGQPETPGAPLLMEVALSVQWGEGQRERIDVRTLRLVDPDFVEDGGL